ncbi:response regulator transcription factor [Mediterraneibacter glycyrrhizinilyticus]|jgi:DNA-binding response OmpR family regulator|uniref:response regulator transcription factor n=1 Tax=Mediterraneibacter glycyrrhizinilyticus TaxID=342942 RepID=UPI000B37376A|nr:response regulator transcription factor [Mediterraneibacter glycyrrhizinilyticus]OUO29816.1 DNA-binding response regulator [Lachnoclostridium sp. An298]HJA20575.1 response regulator transcription factor [Candidatus Mediterraneibacter ornithocaccae]MCF2569227.1 response regulator transcription factor [Mediterraneibacter glycyrrhizinilyticus]MDN0043673.1 response regulator transcription factor [Mediterraneibacter glycyrrhizinilyticus]MDN0060747.1 response regulator transcription factor [Medit
MSYTAKVLLVEDDREIVENLTEYLSTEGYLVKSVNTQKDTMEILEKETFDLLLLDVTLKQGNGYGVCTAVKEKYDLPVIFLTALDDEFSVVTGLDMGADDYISKPFRPRELVSRMRSVLRRSGRTQAVVNIRDIRIDTEKGIVTRAGQELFLSALEYRLLLVFVNNRGMVLTRGRLLDEIWDAAGEFVNDNTLTVYIKRLREKIEKDPQNPEIIMTVRGMGYRLGE